MAQSAQPCNPSRSSDSPDLHEARQILRGEVATPDPASLLGLADRLKASDRMSHARRILELARTAPVRDETIARKLRQRHALCTYKDTDLPAAKRLDLALRILADGEDLDTTTDPETLGLAGAIHKRRWQLDLRREHLERSLSYYRRGYEAGPEHDAGYTGINAAFILDLIAAQEEEEGRPAGTRASMPATRRSEARAIRERILSILEPGRQAGPDAGWWHHATLIEACFGLGRYEDAARHVAAGLAAADIPDWELRTTATQLIELARIQPGAPRSPEAFERTPAGEVIRLLLGREAAAVRSATIGKVGLALSGGGFRASLYHVGVLAALAELDLLRHIEVLSCVSGGSILGAHYYLELKHLLETKADADIARADYIAIVQRLETAFLEGVQKNIRMRVVGGLITNLRMIFQPGYSRTLRVGELYERHLYSRVPDGAGAGPRWLTDLFIRPTADRADFQPRRDNWRRQAKVADLVLNATTLNTGHGWRFTASWMGEPPEDEEGAVDVNDRLRRMYYWEAPEKYQCVRLGHAVAASSCVPGLFEPLALEGLYPERTVRLVDGGVHDNQGADALLEQDCSVVLVSDASGQMGSLAAPSAGVLGVPLRSNSILMSRVRVEQYDELHARVRSKLLRGLMFVHLKHGLSAEVVDWVGCRDPYRRAVPVGRRAEEGGGDGIPSAILRRLSEIRTDLDAFSEVEAFALMYAGWRMTHQAFAGPGLNWMAEDEPARADWRFKAIESHLTVPSRADRLIRLLDVGRYRAFKVWRLVTPLRILGVVLVLVALAALGLLARAYWDRPLVTVGAVASFAIGAIGTAVFGSWAMRAKEPGASVRKIVAGIGLAMLGWLIVGVHLSLFNRLFLRVGRVHER